MVDKIEMSLDDIIKSNKGTRNNSRKGGAPRTAGGIRKGGRPGGPGGNFRGGKRSGAGGAPGGVLKGRARGGIQKAKFSRGDVNSAWKHDLYDGPKRSAVTSGGVAKLLVSNLDYGVSASDITELFADFGPLKNAAVHYDRSGRSLGTADVVFERRADAVKAMKQYNGVPLDGRPMNIQLATSEVPAVAARGRLGGAAAGLGQRSPKGPVRKPAVGGGGRRPATAGGRGGRGGASNPRNKPKPTAEELDAELDAYVNDMK